MVTKITERKIHLMRLITNKLKRNIIISKSNANGNGNNNSVENNSDNEIKLEQDTFNENDIKTIKLKRKGLKVDIAL